MMVQTADKSNQPIFEEYISPTQWPWTLNLLVADSRRILSYMENVPKNAQPPRSIWHSPDKCSEYIDKAMEMDPSKRQEFLEFEEPEMQ